MFNKQNIITTNKNKTFLFVKICAFVKKKKLKQKKMHFNVSKYGLALFNNKKLFKFLKYNNVYN